MSRPTSYSIWGAALLGIVSLKAVLCLSGRPTSLIYSYSAVSYLLLLLVATCFSLRNAIHKILHARPFWMLLAAGFVLWAIHQALGLYYDLWLHIDPPNNSIADDALFLHNVPFIAAIALVPDHRVFGGRPHRWVLDSFMILAFALFLYGCIVAPYKYLLPSPESYGIPFDILYLVANVVLVLIAGAVALRATIPWRSIYLHMLGATALYTISSTAANLAIDSGGYVNGKLYGFGLTASVCWFVWVPLSAEANPATNVHAQSSLHKYDSKISRWAMLLVVLISIPMAGELFHRDEDPKVRTLRLLVATAAIVFLGSGAYLREYFDKRELASAQERCEVALSASEERFKLATRVGKMYAEEWDAATGMAVRSGDLPSVLGLNTDELGSTLQDASMRVHPDDRMLLAASTKERSPEFPSSQIRHRIVRPDGSLIWVERFDQAFFNARQQMVRMVSMVTNISAQKAAEDALRASEEKFRRVFRDAGMGMIIVSPEGRFLAVNTAFCDTFGYSESECLGLTLQAITFEEDWPALARKLEDALQGGPGFSRQEKRCLHKSGRLIYTESSASLIRDCEGKPQFFVYEALDITARKESEEALVCFHQKLIQAQEEERSRISRELHDDINQRVAILAIRLGQLKASRRRSADLVNQVSEIQQELMQLSLGLQHLSHELHSPTLHFLGLTAAIRSWCLEFSKDRNVEVSFESHDVPPNLPPGDSLHLYRVLQEALNNAAKYSGVSRFKVRLWGTSAEIHLMVTDQGKGFDVSSALRARGLGLKSMQERVKILNGSLVIESLPHHGTTILATVPRDPKIIHD